MITLTRELPSLDSIRVLHSCLVGVFQGIDGAINYKDYYPVDLELYAGQGGISFPGPGQGCIFKSRRPAEIYGKY